MIKTDKRIERLSNLITVKESESLIKGLLTEETPGFKQFFLCLFLDFCCY